MRKVILIISLTAMLLLVGGCTVKPTGRPNVSTSSVQRLFDYFNNNSTDKTCVNKDYATENKQIQLDYFPGGSWIKNALVYGLDQLDISLLKIASYPQLDKASYIKLGRALAWQLCNGNSFLTDQALKDSDPEYNLLRNINSPLCTLWSKDIATNDVPDNALYRPLYSDPNVPGDAKIKNYSAMATLNGLDCLEILSISDAINAIYTPGMLLFGQPRTNIVGLFSDVGAIARYMPNLISLDISKSYVPDLGPIRKLSKLEYLIMNGTTTKTTDNFGLFPDAPVSSLTKYLAPLKNLKILDLSNSDAGTLTYLSGLINLRMLNLAHTRTTNLSGLETLENLHYLDISNTKVDSIKQIEKLTQLVYLDISDTKVFDISPLKNLNDLQEINMSKLDKSVFSIYLKIIKNLKSLHTLTATGIFDRSGCTNIKSELPDLTVIC